MTDSSATPAGTPRARAATDSESGRSSAAIIAVLDPHHPRPQASPPKLIHLPASLLTLVLLLTLSAAAQPPHSRIGGIDLFGYAGLPADRVLHALQALHNKPLRSTADARALRDAAARLAQQASGAPATDVALICCEPGGATHLFVGLRGQSSRDLQHPAPPTSADRLPRDGLDLYRREQAATRQAIGHGDAGEDRSMGFSLSGNAAARSIQHAMRAYALRFSRETRTVLLTSADPEQRRAAAALLGYAVRTRDQIAALAAAVDDSDDEVRNNAARALGVMASVGPLDSLDPGPVIALLYSGIWTDRNKAAFILQELTVRRDRRLLDALRREALPPLVEGARWHSPAHAAAFLVILGRIAGLDDRAISTAIAHNDPEPLITAASR